jgi:hypothetical protein
MKFAKVSVVLYFVVASCLGMLANTSKCQAAEDSPSKLAKDYAASEDAKAKTAILEKLIKANTVDSHVAFYELLRTADEAQVPYFKTAMKNSGTGQLIVNIGTHLEVMKAPFLKKANDNPKMTAQELEDLEKQFAAVSSSFTQKLDKLQAEISDVAEKDQAVLIAALNKVFTAKNAEDSNILGPMMGFYAMKEKGAEILFSSIKADSTKKKALLAKLIIALGENAVIPALKKYEDPKSTGDDKNFAGTIVHLLPDSEKIFDKVLEAYKHGRYFEVKQLKKTEDEKVVMKLEDMLEIASSWWGSILESKYSNNKDFVKYVAEKYLSDADGQEKVIYLLSKVGFKGSVPYFMAMDFGKLSDKSLQALLDTTHMMPTTFLLPSMADKMNADASEKFLLFSQIFAKLDAKKREEKQLIVSLSGFPPEYKEKFIKSNVDNLNQKEKQTFAFLCEKGKGKMPDDVQKRIFDILRKDASPELLHTLKYMESTKEE